MIRKLGNYGGPIVPNTCPALALGLIYTHSTHTHTHTHPGLNARTFSVGSTYCAYSVGTHGMQSAYNCDVSDSKCLRCVHVRIFRLKKLEYMTGAFIAGQGIQKSTYTEPFGGSKFDNGFWGANVDNRQAGGFLIRSSLYWLLVIRHLHIKLTQRFLPNTGFPRAVTFKFVFFFHWV